MKQATPTILVIIGITGDLSTRKVLPAISKLIKDNDSFKDLVVLGITRKKEIDVDTLLFNVEDADVLKDHLTIFQMDLNSKNEYDRLDEKLKTIEDTFSTIPQRLFYLSVPPNASLSIIEMLGVSGLSKKNSPKILLEKPLGIDLASAHITIDQIRIYFEKEQVYIIDHYLGKAMTQEFISFRQNEFIFTDTWNNNYIERIEIFANESIGIEGRVSFYEETGALLDLVQSHLLQLAAITLMDTDDIDLHARKLKALKSLYVPIDKSITEYVHRGQYRTYKEEVDNITSTTETYVSVIVESTDTRWAGIPIVLTTGKKLDKKRSEIKITYKKQSDQGPDELLVRIEPEKTITLPFWAKNSSYGPIDYSDKNTATGYEKVFTYAQNSNQDLFVSIEEIIESWRILAPIQEAWKSSSEDLFIYEDGLNPYTYRE